MHNDDIIKMCTKSEMYKIICVGTIFNCVAVSDEFVFVCEYIWFGGWNGGS